MMVGRGNKGRREKKYFSWRRDATVRGTGRKKKRMAKFIRGIGRCTLTYIILREGNGK